MHQITAAQFSAAVGLDYAWASKLTEPVEITDFCHMTSSKITHLSPLLHFTGIGENGDSATFSSCESLKIAEGKFEGWVSFSYSGIEKIGDLSCGKNEDGFSAYFRDCKSLKIAKGKFQGAVNFNNSGIEKIGDLSCGKNINGQSASFQCCESLKVAEGKFAGFADFSCAGIEKIRSLSCGKDEGGESARFRECKSLKIAEGKFEGSVGFSESGIETIGDLSCEKNNSDIRLDVLGCHNLAKIPLTFNPKEIRASLELIEKLEVDRFIHRKRAEIVQIII